MVQFYKANPRVTGTACSFWVNADGTIMASLIKQASWDDKKRTGSFHANKDNPKGRVITKLSHSEAAGIIDVIESNRELSTYHSSQNQVLQIKFGAYIDKKTSEQKGFSFSVNKQDKSDTTNKASFIIGFNYPEARYLKEYLLFVLNYGFDTKLQSILSKSGGNYQSPREELRNESESPQAEQAEQAGEEGNSEDFEW
jgi:hypothetical protein